MSLACPKCSGHYRSLAGADIPAAPPAPIQQAAPAADSMPNGMRHVCNLWVDPSTRNYVIDRCDHPPAECIPAYIKVAPAAESAEPIDDDDLVSVPRGLLGAACGAIIHKKHDAAKTLAELRRYTKGDLSRPTAATADAQGHTHAHCPPPVDDTEGTEREHMGCAHCRTGIYAQGDERDAAWQACREMVGTDGWTVAEAFNFKGFFDHGYRAALSRQPSAPASAPSLLAADHKGMKVDYSGMLGQAQSALGSRNLGIAEMLHQFQLHLEELGRRWYRGDIAVVDELLQLYCVEEDARAALAAAKPEGEQK